MNHAINQQTHAVVVGLGQTGLSAVRYLRARGARVSVTDSRAHPPMLPALRSLDGTVNVSVGGFDIGLVDSADLIVVSPGVARAGEFFDSAQARHVPVVGDVELFARAAQAP